MLTINAFPRTEPRSSAPVPTKLLVCWISVRMEPLPFRSLRTMPRFEAAI